MGHRFKKEHQAECLIKLSELLKEGFPLSEALTFLVHLMVKQKPIFVYMEQALKSGKSFDSILGICGFDQSITTRIYLAQLHGHLQEVLFSCGHQLKERRKQYQKIQQLCLYPTILLCFIIGLIIGIQQFFLPSLEDMFHQSNYENSQFTFFLIKALPVYILWSIVMCVLCFLLLLFYYQKQSPMKKARFLSKIPFIKKWIKWYYTSYFSRELAYLLGSQYGFNEVVDVLKKGNTLPLLKEFIVLVEHYMQQGQTISDVIRKLPFLSEEMALVIEHGEKISHLSMKLSVFSKDNLEKLEKDIHQKMTWIQPILFLSVGLFIVAIYIALMMPMFDMVNHVLVE
ncbi:type II secretion system F family protein [Carnobacteriaceae bacterium zg-ZUI78]|nr:type II secretion system F family protein [Carnobacteriaceae bacterium zg-ZUI78]